MMPMAMNERNHLYLYILFLFSIPLLDFDTFEPHLFSFAAH